MNRFIPDLLSAISFTRLLHYRLPQSHKGRALFLAKYVNPIRQQTQFQEKLLSLADNDIVDTYKQELQQRKLEEDKRKSLAEKLMQSTIFLGEKIAEGVQSWMTSEPVIVALPFDVRGRLVKQGTNIFLYILCRSELFFDTIQGEPSGGLLFISAIWPSRS